MKRHIFFILGFLLLCGCKAEPAKTSPFFGDTEGMVADPSVRTFHKTWAKPNVDWERFKKIHIPPVNTSFLREMTWWEKTNLAGQDEKGIEELAMFTRKAFIEAHRKNKHPNRLEVVNKPDDRTLILELALIEVIPTKVWLNTVGYVGMGTALDKGSVAMEARLRDGRTGEIIAKFADREAGKYNVINIKDLTWYGHAKAIVKEWAEQSVAITNAGPNEIIKDSFPFELKVW